MGGPHVPDRNRLLDLQENGQYLDISQALDRYYQLYIFYEVDNIMLKNDAKPGPIVTNFPQNFVNFPQVLVRVLNL